MAHSQDEPRESKRTFGMNLGVVGGLAACENSIAVRQEKRI